MSTPHAELESLRDVAIAFPVIITLAVGLRFYTRQVYARLAIDDWLMLIAWPVFILNCALGLVLVDIIESSKGPPLPELFFRVLRAKASSWVVCIMFLKLSLCFYFLKIFVIELFRVQRYIIIIVIAIYEVFSFVYFIFTCTSCGLLVVDPARRASCDQSQSYHILSFTWSVTNIVSDFVLGGLAANAVHNAHINLSAHISAYLILALGTLGGIASILRLIFTAGTGLTLTKTTIWAIVEAGCGILAASLATLRPLLRAAMHIVRPGHTTHDATAEGTAGSHALSSRRRPRKDSISSDELVLQARITGQDLENGESPDGRQQGGSFITSAITKE